MTDADKPTPPAGPGDEGAPSSGLVEDPASLSFEAAFHLLEEAVTRLESGDLALEEALALYEYGARLARRCDELLSAAELKVRQLDQEGRPARDLTIRP